MKPRRSRKAELASNTMSGEKSHAETAESAEFKMTELGPIPVDWDVKRLGELWSSFKTGPFGSSLHAQDYIENGTPLINPMHIQDGKIEPSADMTVDDSTKHRLSAYKLSQDDIVVGRRGEMGRAALVGEKENGWLCGTGCFFLHLKESCCPSYIALYLRTPTSVASLNGEAVGTTLVNLNQKILSDLKLPLPPLAEQRRIAGALSDVDELISALGNLIEKKRNIKTGAMQQLLTGKTRLPGFKGKWMKKRLGECGKLIRDSINTQAFPNKVFFEYSMPSYDDGKIPRAVLGRNIYSNKTPIHGEVLLFNKLNVRKRRIWYVLESRPDAICSSEFLPLYSNTTDLYFLSYAVSLDECTSAFEDCSSGTSNSQKRITPDDFENYELVIPPTLAEQKAIAAVLSDMDAEIAALEADRAKYERIKYGMMQELLTGKTRLKGE